jgi:hypothetical protein
MESKWMDMKVGIVDIAHPNSDIILGKDFEKLFVMIDVNPLNREVTLNY